jgi:hypothetical protein
MIGGMIEGVETIGLPVLEGEGIGGGDKEAVFIEAVASNWVHE